MVHTYPQGRVWVSVKRGLTVYSSPLKIFKRVYPPLYPQSRPVFSKKSRFKQKYYTFLLKMDFFAKQQILRTLEIICSKMQVFCLTPLIFLGRVVDPSPQFSLMDVGLLFSKEKWNFFKNPLDGQRNKKYLTYFYDGFSPSFFLEIKKKIFWNSCHVSERITPTTPALWHIRANSIKNNKKLFVK